MRQVRIAAMIVSAAAILLCSVATSAEQWTGESAKQVRAESRNPGPQEAEEEVPEWDSLTEQAREASMERFSTEELRTQADKKEARLDALTDEQAQLEGKLASILSGSQTTLAQIDRIEDPVLRDESLLRYRSAKRVQMEALRVRLKSVTDEIERERSELRTVQQLLQSRRAEARLHGQNVDPEGSYREYLSREAARARQSEDEILRQVRAARLRRLNAVIVPRLEPVVPSLSSAVLWSNGE
jgi:chromosome segregation ATPase